MLEQPAQVISHTNYYKMKLRLFIVLFCIGLTACLKAQDNQPIDNEKQLLAKPKEHRLTWSVGPRGTRGPAFFKIEYFLDGVSEGYGDEALESIYNKISNGNAEKLTIVCSNAKFPTFDPIRQCDLIQKIYPLLRGKKIQLALEFDEFVDPVIAPYTNPFALVKPEPPAK